jgi:hypothetical protein
MSTEIIYTVAGLIVGGVVGFITGKSAIIQSINEKFGFIVVTRKGQVRNIR